MEPLLLVGEDADGAIAVQLQLDGGKPWFYWLKHYSRNTFLRVSSDGRNTVQAGGSVQASL